MNANVHRYWIEQFNTKLGYLHYFIAYYMKYSRLSFIDATRFVLKQSVVAQSGKSLLPEDLSDCGYHCHKQHWYYTENDLQQINADLLAALILSSDV